MSGQLVAPMMKTFFLEFMPSISVMIWLMTQFAAPHVRVCVCVCVCACVLVQVSWYLYVRVSMHVYTCTVCMFVFARMTYIVFRFMFGC